jgi:hypothetical protein
MSLHADLVKLIFDGIMVQQGRVIDASVALERARNIAMGLTGNFKVERFPEEFPPRPDPDTEPDDGRIA